jgi:hypothetical protein
MSALSRRDFLGSSIKLGAGAAALSLTGVGADVLMSPAAGALTAPPPPTVAQTFVSRPDLRPPGVAVSRGAGVPNHPGYVFLAPISIVAGIPPTVQGLMITDAFGNLIWWKPMPAATEKPFNFRMQRYQGKPVLTWYQGTLVNAPVVPGGGMPGRYGSTGTAVIADSSYTPIETVQAQGIGTDLHEFLITPEDTALVTAYKVVGNLVVSYAQEVAIGNNELVWEWSSYPAVRTPQSYTGTAGDYFHINSVDLWPGPDRDFLISSRNTFAVYLVSRKTKRIIWRVGGKSSTFAQGVGSRFSFQHDARALLDGSGLSLFDDASAGVPESQSWGKVITLNQKTKRASLRHEFGHTTGSLRAGNSGNVQLLPNGGHLVGWGSAPFFSVFAPSGAVVEAPLILDGRIADGLQSYRWFMSDWVGTPRQSEFVAVVRTRTSGEQFSAYVSWNGATQVNHYSVLAGPTAGTLRPVTGTGVARTGFETAIPFTTRGAHQFQVVAYSSKGQILGRTAVVGVTTA